MAKDDRDILEILKDELAFIEKAGMDDPSAHHGNRNPFRLS